MTTEENLDLSKVSTIKHWLLAIDYILSVSICFQNLNKIFFLKDLWQVLLFCNSDLGESSKIEKHYLGIFWARCFHDLCEPKCQQKLRIMIGFTDHI